MLEDIIAYILLFIHLFIEKRYSIYNNDCVWIGIHAVHYIGKLIICV